MNLIEKQISTQKIYEGKIITVRKDTALLPNGKTAIREIVEHNGGICIAPLTENNELIFVKQFRYPYGEILLELPAGKRDKDEDPLEGAKRELKEETGATAGKIVSLGQLYPTVAYCDEIIWLYLATNLKFGEQKLDEDEFLSVSKIPLETAAEMVLNGEIKDSKTQVAILKIKMLKDKGLL
ncbi:MAG: NUDIX hydrolase [Clostridia bacterium]|nr:NUDIX hydrolase [Clostridia bacterium]